MTLSLRYNPTYRGVIKGTENVSNVSELSYRDFIEHDLDYDFCVNKTEEILQKNISKISAKKVVTGLSGGTDSSLNTLLLAKNDKVSLKCFCIGFDDADDEFDDARIVAKVANCEYKEIIIKDLMYDLPTMIWKFGAPKSNLWPYHNFKTVRDLGGKTTLSGEGGDELFGGYYFRYVKYLKNIPRTPFGKAKKYVYSRTRDWIPNQEKMFGICFKKNNKLIFNSKNLISFFEKTFTNNLHYINQIFLADFNFKLRFDFNYVDTILAKSEGVKIESPFLKPNIIRFATHIPYKYKLGKNTSKMILRDILKRLGAPEQIYKKPKQGWGMRPTTVWNRGLREKCKQFVLDGNLVRDGWINKNWLQETFSLIENKKNSQPEFVYGQINKIWDVLSFEIFYIQRILNESKNGKIANW